MNSSWYMDIEPRVFSLIKSYTYTDLVAKYPSILFTTIDALPTDTTYSHTVYIHELNGVEVGRDLENIGVNAYESTFEVKVSVTELDSTSKKQEVRDIVGYITEAFKKLKFNIVAMPTVEISSSAYTCPIRFRRIIGANDTL